MGKEDEPKCWEDMNTGEKFTQREQQQRFYNIDDDFYDKLAPKWAAEMRKRLRGRKARALRRYLKHPERHISSDPLYCGCPFKDYHPWVYNHITSQLSGWCYYLNTGDFMPTGTSLLWDGCKECDVNNDWDGLEQEFTQAELIKENKFAYEIFLLRKKGGSKKAKEKRVQKFLKEQASMME